MVDDTAMPESGDEQVDRRPGCSPPFTTAQASFRPVVVALLVQRAAASPSRRVGDRAVASQVSGKSCPNQSTTVSTKDADIRRAT
jgi:hypothetical protein